MAQYPNYSPEVMLASINSGRVGLPLSHSGALEIIGHLEGYPHWNDIARRRDASIMKERAKIMRLRVNASIEDGKISESTAQKVVDEIKRIPSFLYRGVRLEEMEASRILAKRQGPFAQDIKVPFVVGSQTVIGPSVDNAAKNHQKNVGANRGLFETSGVSTTTEREIAARFATNNGTRDGFMVVIHRDLLAQYGVSEYDVVARSSEVQKPEEKEVILFMENGGPFPEEIIDAYGPVAASEYLGPA